MKMYRAILRTSHSFSRWHSPLAEDLFHHIRVNGHLLVQYELYTLILYANSSLATLPSNNLPSFHISLAVDRLFECVHCTHILYHQLCISTKCVYISSWMLFTFMLVRNFVPRHAKSIFTYRTRIYAPENRTFSNAHRSIEMCGI